jgi:hypothetical protein
MKKRILLCLTASLAVVTVLVLRQPTPRTVLLGLLRDESFYKGRPTSYWSGAIKSWAANFYALPPAPLPPAPTWYGRLRAVLAGLTAADDALPGAGGDPKAIPVLIELLRDKDAVVREWAAGNLAMMPSNPEAAHTFATNLPKAVPALIEVLRDEDRGVRQRAAECVRMWAPAMGTKAQAALPILTDLLRDDAPGVRWEAVAALAEIEPRAEVTVPLLLPLMADEDVFVRRRVASLFGYMGVPARGAVPALREALGDEDSQVRREAAEALAKIEP